MRLLRLCVLWGIMKRLDSEDLMLNGLLIFVEASRLLVCRYSHGWVTASSWNAVASHMLACCSVDRWDVGLQDVLWWCSS